MAIALLFSSPSFSQECPVETQSCEGAVQRALSDARNSFRSMCSGTPIRDCDRVSGGWQCSSEVIGDSAPASTAGSSNNVPLCESSAEQTVSIDLPVPEPEPVLIPVPDAPPQPGDSDDDVMPLVIGLPEANKYGYRFNGTNNRLLKARFSFQSSSEVLTLTVTGNDIDTEDEIGIYLNGNLLGYLGVTPDNGSTVNDIPINVEDQQDGTNIIEFRQRRSGWRWGVVDLLLTPGCNYPLVQI